MIIRMLMFLIIGLSAANVSFAQSREPSMGSETSDTGSSATSTAVWPSADSSSSGGADSSDHGNVS